MLHDSRILSVVAYKKFVRSNLPIVKPLVSVTLMILLFASSIPPAIASSLVREAALGARLEAATLSANVIGLTDKAFAHLPSTGPRGLMWKRPESKAEREGRAASLRINTSGDIVLESRQRMVFSAIPFDRNGNAVHGLHAEWESTNTLVVFVKKSGEALAGKPGTAKLTARAGRLKESVEVTVVEGTRDEFGGLEKPGSNTETKHHHAKSQRLNKSNDPGGAKAEPVSAFMPQRPPLDDPLPDNQTPSLYQASNSVGSPPGKTVPGARMPAAATAGTENPGSENFTFGIPVFGIPGRGIDASLGLVHNSQLFNKSTDPNTGSTFMTYDVDSGWPAPGWRLGYGQIENQSSFGFTLTDADGTRHSLNLTSTNNYDTSDGTFIHYTGSGGSGTLFYADGTQVTYGAGGGGYRIYPTKITDRNGNYILISYVGGIGPKISSIEDTLQRYVNFYYASNGDLVTITEPGLTGQPDRAVMRLYYDTISLTSAGLFQSSINVSSNTPTSVHVIKYIYLPNSVETSQAHIGYKFEYSSCAMMYKATQFRGMTASWTGNTDPGQYPNEGTLAATTTYNYEGTPLRPIPSDGLADAPDYTQRTDDWAGRVSAQPVYQFSVDKAAGISTVTAPDGSVTESHTVVDPSQWDHGLVSDVYVDKQGSTFLSHTKMDWDPASTGNPRVQQIRATNDGGQTKATVLSYTTYNNISVVSERDLTTDGSVSPTELRRTETTYVTSSSYINRHLLHLPATVQVFAGSAAAPTARVDYAYDNYGAGHANLTRRDDIIMHDPAFDPFQQTIEANCHWECWDWEWHSCLDWEWVCDLYNPYDPSTDYRGNVTSVTTYPDATNTANSITHSTTYDIAGNVMTAQVDCCQQKSFTYSNSAGLHDYAYPTSVTSGGGSTALTSSASYDSNTGMVATATDENSQVTTNFYNSDSLRIDHVTPPDGGATYVNYSEALALDGSGSSHYSVQTSTRLDSARSIVSQRYFDGRGAVARTMANQTSANGWSTQDVEYDVMGRAYRASNPYYASGPSASINPDGYWTTSTFDHLGRVTVVTMPRGDEDTGHTLTTNVQNSYDGIYTTVTDQAGKVRRQKVDALGRVIRLDEPTTSGLGSTSSPNQATNYSYDVLDNLVHINQGSQDRYFKYDSLSRLIRERQVEQSTNSSYDLSDSLTNNSSWSRRLDYNSSGLVSDAYDARGVHTQFVYDGLNRVTQITYSDSTPPAFYYYDSQTLPTGAPSYTHTNTTGRLLAMTYGSSSSTTGDYFAYDSMGRVTTQKQVTGSATYNLSYTYNYAGLLTGETYPSGRSLAYSYDEGGRLSQVSDGSTTFDNSFAYSAHGGLTSEAFGNGMVHKLEYNRRLQASAVKLLQNSGAMTPLQQFDYGYGEFNTSTGAVDSSKNNGQIGKITGTIGGTTQWLQGFQYDELGRLKNVAEYQSGNMSSQTYSQSYTFDRYGNRFQSANSTLGLPSVASSDYDTTNNNNRFVSSVATYDAAGNILSDAKFRGMNYSYDANGRMTYAYHTDSGGGTDAQASVYDCAGQRVQTSANNVTRTMVYDVVGQLVADYLGSSGSTLERENIYRGGQLLAVYETGASCYKSISQFVQDFHQGVLHRQPTYTELTNWTTTLTQAQAQGAGQLIVAAQSLGTTLFTSSEYLSLNPDIPANRGQFVTDLYAGYLGRVPDGYGYQAWLNALNTGSSRDDVRHGFAYSAEFQSDVGQLCVSTSSTGPNYKYVLSDLQGTTRAVMNNSGSSSAVIARHDYLPFGEEVWAGSYRSSSYSYGQTDANRQKYGLTERDDATGLDHTWWRKLESFSGRWTSPDPYARSMRVANPQSFNRYAYVQNDPVNFVDPSGLYWAQSCSLWAWFDVTDPKHPKQVSDPWVQCTTYWVDDFLPFGGGGGGGGGGPQGPPTLKPDPKREKECAEHRRNLLENPTNKAAIDAAWKASQYGTAGARETGGLLGRSLLIHASNHTVAQLYFPPASSRRASLEGHTGWVKNQISNNANMVEYDYSFHTHPFDEGEPNPDGPGTTGNPNNISDHDEGSIRQQAQAQPGLHGVVVSSTSIVVYDSNGTVLCTFSR